MNPSSKTMVCLSTTQCRYIELLLQSPVHQPVIHQSIGPLAKQNLIIILHLHLECHCFQKCISIAVVVPHRTIRFVGLSYNHRIPQTHLIPILGIVIHYTQRRTHCWFPEIDRLYQRGMNIVSYVQVTNMWWPKEALGNKRVHLWSGSSYHLLTELLNHRMRTRNCDFQSK